MELVQKIDEELATAMREGVASRVAVLRLIKNAFKNEQIKTRQDLSEGDALKVLQREAKQRKDSIEQYKNAGRDDLAESERHELEIIESYLPQQMSDEELNALVDEIVKETGAEGMSQMGVVIGAVMQRAAGRAEGSKVSQAVKSRLQ